MKGIDVRSFLIGVLLSAVVALGIAAAGQGPSRYSVSMCSASAPATFYVCILDSVTGKYSVQRGLELTPASSSTMTPMGRFENPLAE